MEEQYVRQLAAHEEKISDNTRRIGVLEKNTSVLHEMAKSLALMAQRQQTMGEQIDEVVSDVKTLKDAPAKKWQFVVEKSIYIVVSAVITYILTRAGLA